MLRRAVTELFVVMYSGMATMGHGCAAALVEGRRSEVDDSGGRAVSAFAPDVPGRDVSTKRPVPEFDAAASGRAPLVTAARQKERQRDASRFIVLFTN